MELLNMCEHDEEWAIKYVDDKFLVGSRNRRTQVFEPICSCEFYYQAYLVIEALKHFIYARNYSYRGVDQCPEATASFLKQTAKTVLPG